VQSSLFNAATAAPVDAHSDRPYQADAIAAIRRELTTRRSTLLVLATGLGKTHVFSRVAAGWPTRVLVLAHRDELIRQAVTRIERLTGRLVDLEQAESRAGGTHVVVGSVQTLQNASRRARWQPADFGLIIVDEAHHASARSYGSILKHFPAARVLGVTATPDRTDKKALGAVFESVAYEMGIGAGIRGGYLCPVRCWPVYVESIDLSNVRTTAGDLNQGDQDRLMATEANLHGVARPLLGIGGVNRVGDRKTIVFSGPGVATAVKLTEVLNDYRPGCARVVHGKTDDLTRRANLRDHERGEYQFLVNVGIATEGYDSPTVACVAIARATGSRALYAQMVGRGLRTSSGKADCLIVDFYGTSGRHDLANPVDLLGGDYPDDVKQLAKESQRLTPGGDVEETLKLAAEELDKRRAAKLAKELAEAEARSRIRREAKLSVTWRGGDPFDLLGGTYEPGPTALAKDVKLASPAHVEILDRHGFKAPVEGWTSDVAGKLLAYVTERETKGLASPRQVRTLQSAGVDAKAMGRVMANKLCAILFDRKAKGGKWMLFPHEMPKAVSNVA
jgi:superfamily II DNA or RNA helicase